MGTSAGLGIVGERRRAEHRLGVEPQGVGDIVVREAASLRAGVRTGRQSCAPPMHSTIDRLASHWRSPRFASFLAVSEDV